VQKEERSKLMNMRRGFAAAVAGKFLDRINMIDRIEKGARA